MGRIKMKAPIVEMQGDEMTRILWDWIKEILIEPYVELKTEFYDLGLSHRDDTNDAVTMDAAKAIIKYGVGVKCATITPNAQRVEEYKLKKMWVSPNGTIRAALDGTVFRTPIIVKGIKTFIPAWTKPITVARHAYGDVYKNSELYVDGAAKAELVVTKQNGEVIKKGIHDFTGKGIIMGMHNTDDSITNFAKACFEFALSVKQDLWFGTKDTISKIYDHRFKDIFQEIYDSLYKAKFEKEGIKYEYTLIDDSVSRVIRSDGGFVWALKNYDGDVMSDMVATAYGSLAMMSSVLVSPDGKYEYEAAHGTVTRHYYNHLKGIKTSTNPVATIFAWTGALYRRGIMDGLKDLCDFAKRLEEAVLKTIESGTVTGDLAILWNNPEIAVNKVGSREFLEETAKRL